jgi:tRNA threonylcarbamoyladenosine dehydratase
MERLSAIFQSEPAKFFAVVLVVSIATIQAHILYTDIRTNSQKDKMNRELRELYGNDQVPANGADQGSIGENGKADSVASAEGKGAAIVSSLPLGVTGFDEELIREQLARNYAFFGEDGMAKIRNSTVVIVGCGGVGSWAAIMLARTYVPRIHRYA